MRCLIGAMFNMRATVLKPAGSPEAPVTSDSTSVGKWQYVQDPTSGAITRTWVEVPDNPSTSVDENAEFNDVPCSVRGIIDGGIRVAGTTERFDKTYENVDWVKATFPPNVNITKRDKVTNIRNARGVVVWTNEESNGKPTVFNVMGVTPVLDSFSRIIYTTALLERSEVQ